MSMIWKQAGLAASVAAMAMAAAVAAPGCRAQGEAPPPQVAGIARGVGQAQQGPTGSVSGRIVFGDTQAPARFAQVVLIPVQSVQTDSRPGGGFRGFNMGGNGRTDLDGNFTLANVAVGDYYVSGQAPGYISETAILQARAAEGADADALLAGLPTAHVTAGTMATVNVSLSRGATVAGHLQWDDGSPASGVQVSASMVSAGTTATAAFNQAGGRGGFAGGFAGASSGGFTDDRGEFRISGLAPGVYTVRVTLQAPASGGSPTFMQRAQTITLYAPGKVRRADAQTFTLHAGEERDDLQMVLNLRALHTVTGRVGAASGPEPESGSVRLVDTTDSTLSRTASLAADGSFALTYVPAGNYTLSVSGASTTPLSSFGGRRGGSTSSSPGVAFQPFSETLSVTDTDVSGVAVNLTPASQ
jgi:hypothetical protein